MYSATLLHNGLNMGEAILASPHEAMTTLLDMIPSDGKGTYLAIVKRQGNAQDGPIWAWAFHDGPNTGTLMFRSFDISIPIRRSINPFCTGV